jgi:hypothetical protein
MARNAKQKAFRRSLVIDEKEKRWMEWLSGPGKALLDAGIPRDVLYDEEHWIDLLLHGSSHFVAWTTKFSAYDIPDEKLPGLVKFLDGILPEKDKPYSGLYKI